MNNEKKTELQLRKMRQARDLALAQAVLARDNKQKAQNRKPKLKRKSVEDLKRFLDISLLDARAVRSAETFRSRTYNLARQVEELLNHMFARYPVPDFLYRCLLSPEGKVLVRQESNARAFQKQPRAEIIWERELFMATAQGVSLAKLLKSELTKREIHFFLRAPGHVSAREAVLWAKFTAGGIPSPMVPLLLERLGDEATQRQLGGRAPDLYLFFARYGREMNRATLTNLLDFVAAMIPQANFSFKGRTLRSMIQLSQDWHRRNSYGSLGALKRWATMFEAWEYRTAKTWVRAVELVTNRDLHDESRRQDHCVFMYVGSCLSGGTRIVRMSWMQNTLPSITEATRLTVQVNTLSRLVVQVKGKANREPTDDEMKIVRRWAGENGLGISLHAW